MNCDKFGVSWSARGTTMYCTGCPHLSGGRGKVFLCIWDGWEKATIDQYTSQEIMEAIAFHNDYNTPEKAKERVNKARALRKLEAIQSLGLVSLITDMIEDLMAHYNHWQENRDFEGYHKPVKNSDMRAVRKYMEDFRAINKKLKEVLGK